MALRRIVATAVVAALVVACSTDVERHRDASSAPSDATGLGLGGDPALHLSADWQTRPDLAVASFAKAPNGQRSETLPPDRYGRVYGTSLFLGNVAKAGQSPWYVYLTNIDAGARSALCQPMDGSSPRLASWGQFHGHREVDAGIVINACLQGLESMTGGGWRLGLPFDSYGTRLSDPVYYVATQIRMNHAVTLSTAEGVPGPATSCYHTVSEAHGWQGQRNWGGAIYDGQTYRQGVSCVHLAAAPCPNCGLPDAQFGNPAFPGPRTQTSFASQEGFVHMGTGTLPAGEVHDITLQNVILDGNRDERNAHGQCYYNEHNGTYNLSMSYCRRCRILGIASLRNLCGANVQADTVGGMVAWNTVGESGALTGSQVDQSDGLTFHSAKDTVVHANVLRDATDGNSFFSARGLSFQHNAVSVSSSAVQHSAFNFCWQPGTKFAEALPGDFAFMTVANNTITTTNVPSNVQLPWRGANVGIELGSDPWWLGISDFSNSRFYNNGMSGVLWGYDLAGVGRRDGGGTPWLCNGSFDAATGACIERPIIALSPNPSNTVVHLSKARLNFCHVSLWRFAYGGFGAPATFPSAWNSADYVTPRWGDEKKAGDVPCDATPAEYVP
jgi:hypothetical protein